MRVDLLQALLERQAEVAVGASTARNPGARGTVKALRRALAKVRLADFSVRDEKRFLRALDRHTQRVRGRLPPKARSWGLARKCLNIYLRDCLYNAYLRRHYRLAVAEPRLEVPLDSLVVKGLKAQFPKRALPRWLGVKYLHPSVSAEFQAAAHRVARSWGIKRVHLDAFFWVGGRR